MAISLVIAYNRVIEDEHKKDKRVDKLFTRYKSKKEVVKEEIPKEEVSVKEKRIGRGAVVSEKK